MKQNNPRSAKPSPEPDCLAAEDVTSENSTRGSSPTETSPSPRETANDSQSSPIEVAQHPEPKPIEQLIPQILFEGDQPEPVTPAQPAGKFAQAFVTESPRAEPGGVTLPESYGTNRLLLTARDPQCLYAHWDASPKEAESQTGSAGHQQLVLRIHRETLNGPVVKEIGIHPDSRHCFVEVEDASGIYVAELGRQLPDGSWTRITASETAIAPIHSAAQQSPVQFATLTFDAPTDPALGQDQGQTAAAPLATSDVDEPALAMDEPERQFPLPPPLAPLAPQTTGLLPPFGEPADQYQWPEDLPLHRPMTPTQESLSRFLTPVPAEAWTATQERALAELMGPDLLSHSRLKSPETSLKSTSVPNSSLLLQEQASLRRPFWLNVNAELIIYGATEPDARVVVGGEPIRVRTDGTFSCRFALPDGFYRLAVSATSAHGDGRQAEFDFSRSTNYNAQAGLHPQTPGLKTPPAQT